MIDRRTILKSLAALCGLGWLPRAVKAEPDASDCVESVDYQGRFQRARYRQWGSCRPPKKELMDFLAVPEGFERVHCSVMQNERQNFTAIFLTDRKKT